MRKVLTMLIIGFFLMGTTVSGIEVSEKIKIANLVIGLELTPQHLDYLKEAQHDILLHKKDLMNSTLAQEREKLLNEIYSQLRMNGKISPETAKEFHKVNAQFKRQAERLLELAREKAKGFLNLLQPYQRKALEEYIPCIIPPEKGNRLGQAERNPHIVKLLERVRRIPDFLWERIRDDIAERIASRSPRYFLMDDKEREERKEGILSLLERIRELNDVDFMVERENLALELKPREKKKNAVAVVMKFLLSPAASQVVEEFHLTGRLNGN